MKFTLNWLKQYLDTDATLEIILEKLTSIGLEVEGVVDRSRELAGFKIAQIIEARQHPDADKLRVCQVDTGEERLQIVCGAPNARAGINVVLAPVGSIIPASGIKIRASKIRGVESFGMLCSAAELGLGEDGEGIIEMPASNDNIAIEYAEVAGLKDPVIEVSITPNRGDCLGVYGIARDLAATGIGKLKPIMVNDVRSDFKSPISVRIEDSKNCPLFIGRYFKDVKNGSSPQWLKQRLEAIGLRSISALVDITNYIAFEFGRPLHVYDANKISENIVIRSAKEGEKIVALDDKEYILDNTITVVADEHKSQAIAGVIGGKDSGCDEETTNVFLEVALFDSVSVANSGRKLDIITDSRYRFERNVDPLFLNAAVQIASAMILDLCGGRASEVVIAGQEPNWQREITFDFDFVSKLSAIDISKNESVKILQSLGFEVRDNIIKVPSWRKDVEGQEDIVEEITRIYGFDKIPALDLPEFGHGVKDILSEKQKRVMLVRRNLASIGMTEVVSWSFMKSKTAKLFAGGNQKLQLLNPISSDLDEMRPNILPNLLDAVSKNYDRGYENLAFFEIGLVFEDTSIEGQKQVVSAVRSGKTSFKEVHGTSRNVDVFDAKSDCLAALEASSVPIDNLRITTDAPIWYHPGRSGVLRLGKTALARFGEIHPKILKELNVKTNVVAFEVFFDAIPDVRKKTKAKPKLVTSEYQSSVRDFAFIADVNLAADDLLRAVKACDKKLIEEVSLFDIYQGKGVEENKKSVAISVVIRADDHTLSESEIDAVSKKIIEAAGKLGGRLRE